MTGRSEHGLEKAARRYFYPEWERRHGIPTWGTADLTVTPGYSMYVLVRAASLLRTGTVQSLPQDIFVCLESHKHV